MLKYCIVVFIGEQLPNVMSFLERAVDPSSGGGQPATYTCKLCGYSTVHGTTARRHMIRKHAQHRIVFCQFCHKACKHEEALKSHMSRCLKKQKFPTGPGTGNVSEYLSLQHDMK